MEGVPVTVEEVHRILAGDHPPETTAEDAALVRGYRDAMNFVLRRADDAAFKWDRELLIGLHDRIVAGNRAAGAGGFRTGSAYVVDNRTSELRFQPPAPEATAEFVDSACAVMQKGLEHPAIAAAWIHVAVAAIHPFKDGNGRASRIIASLAMYRGGFKLPEFTSLEEWWGRHLSDYAGFRCLGDAFDANADVTPFIHAHMQAQLHQVRALALRLLRKECDASLLSSPRGRESSHGDYRSRGRRRGGSARAGGKGRSRRYRAGDHRYPRIGSALGVEVDESGETGRATIIGELTRRVAAARLQ